MRSATREALAAARETLPTASSASLAMGEELLAAGRALGEAPALRSALTDTAAATEARVSLVRRVFSSLGEQARGVLETVVSSRWSSEDDLLAGIEDLGIRVIAASAGEDSDIIGELFAFGRAVSSEPELELAVGSRLSAPAAKVALVERLLEGKASAQTIAILTHLVQQPRGRRVGALLREAADTVADARGLRIATVTAASELTDDQSKRLTELLSSTYGPVHLNVILDPAIIGGVRVQVGDHVIDDSIATRLAALKLELAG